MSRNVRRLPSIASCLVLSVPVAGECIEDWRLETELSYARGLESGNAIEESVQLEAEGIFRISSNLVWKMGALATYEPSGVLRPNRGDARVLDYTNRVNRRVDFGAYGDLELRDFYLEWSGKTSRLRIGKQQVNWSSLDGLPLLLLNPFSFDRFLLNDESERRLPQWGVYFDTAITKWRFETAIFLDESVHDIPDPGSWFEFTAPQFRFGLTPSDLLALSAIETRLPDAVRDPTIALRVTRAFSDTQLSMVALSGNEYEAIGQLRDDATDVVLERSFPRRNLIAVTLETGLGPAVLRAEAVGEFGKTMNVVGETGLDDIEVDTVGIGLSTDLELPFDLFANAQLLTQEILDAPTELVKPRRFTIATMTLRRNFAYDRFSLELRGYSELEREDNMASVVAAYNATDTTSILLQTVRFSGSELGVFGQFQSRDLFRVLLRHSF